MRIPRVTYASVVLLLFGCLFFIAGQAAACHVTVTNDILNGDPDNPDIEFGFTLSDSQGLVGEEVFLGDGDSFFWSGLDLWTEYTLTQTAPLPEGWALIALDSDEDAGWVNYDVDNFQIEFSLALGKWALDTIFTNEYSSVPVPAAGWLMGAGILGLIGFRRKIKA